VDRRTFVAGTLGLVAAPLAAEAQPAGKVPRIAYLSLTQADTARRGFRRRPASIGAEGDADERVSARRVRPVRRPDDGNRERYSRSKRREARYARIS
jgi:hypothetical protein